MVQVHRNAERAQMFLSDDGLPGGAEPEAVLERRLYRLEEIMRTLPETEPDEQTGLA